MTTPSQAQIEAAEIIRGLMHFADGHELQEPARTELRQLKQRAAALTAAAEVGEKRHPAYAYAEGAKMEEIEESTIERCAQELARLRQHEFGEADQFAIGFNEAIKQAQFRIRALKDKP